MLPGFGLTLGFTLSYLCLLVLIPLAGSSSSAATLGWSRAVASGHVAAGASRRTG